jgi:hypothetical protein
VVCRLTLATYPAPQSLGLVARTITASSDAGFRRLLVRMARVMPALCDDHWVDQSRRQARRSTRPVLERAQPE